MCNIVLVHGFLEHPKMWDFLDGDLDQTINLKVQGHAGRALQHRGLGLDGYVQDLAEQLSALDSTSNILVGHSMGGYIAAAFAAKYPDWVDGIVFFHSTSNADSPEKKKKREQALLALEHNKKQYCSLMIRSLFPETFIDQNEDLYDQLIAGALEIPTPNIADALRSMRDREDQSSVLEQSEIPVAFVLGELDPTLPPENSIAERDRLNVVYTEILKDCGHMGQWEMPQDAAKSIDNAVRTVLGNRKTSS